MRRVLKLPPQMNGVRSSQVVEDIEVAHAPIRRESSRLRGGRIAVDDAHLFIGPRHTHTEKLEGALFLIRNEFPDDLVVGDVDASVLDDGNVVIVVVDGDMLFNDIRDQAHDPGFNASFECGVEAFI